VKTEKSCFEQNNAWYAVVLICLDINYTKFGKLILRKIIENAATTHQMSYLKVKMHQI